METRLKLPDSFPKESGAHETRREARGNEEREKREDKKGSHCFFKSSRYDKLELKYQNLVFFKLIECIIKMSWCEAVCKKICAIGGTENKLKSLS